MPPSPYIDLTHTVIHNMPVYPGDFPVTLEQTNNCREHGFTLFRLKSSMHIRTHMDGPLHMLEEGPLLSDVPVSRFFGRGVIIDVRGEREIAYKEQYNGVFHGGDMVFFCTGRSSLFGTPEYYDDYPVLTEKYADVLVRAGVNMVGFDSPSPDIAPFPIHKRLFKAGIPIIESLAKLEQLLDAGPCTIYAFPFKIAADSAFVRVVARMENAYSGRPA